MILCEVCGNEFDRIMASCPFCGASSGSSGVSSVGAMHRVVNLERGLPTVAEALARLDVELETARRQKYRVLTLIHGYGSSGKGGAIKAAVHRQLEYFKHQGRINDLVAGEDFNSRSGIGRHLLRRFPFLATHSDLNRSNRGVTLVIL
jgi:hypothetical protein